MTWPDHDALLSGQGDPAFDAFNIERDPSALGPFVAAVGGVLGATENILFHMTVLRLVAAADDRRFLPRATHDVETAAADLAAAEQARIVALERLADEWSLAADTLTLEKVADRAPEGVAVALREHRKHLAALTADLERTAADVHRLVGASLSALAEILETSSSSTGAYGADGRSRKGPGRARIHRAL